MPENNDVTNVAPVPVSDSSAPVSAPVSSPVPVSDSSPPVSAPVVSSTDVSKTAQIDFLAAIPADKSFITSNGRAIHSLEELYDSVSADNGAMFHTHVTDVRNDFSNWIRSSLNYSALADKLLPVHDKTNFLKILGEDIAFLKDPKLKSTMRFFQDPQDAVVNSSSSSSGEIAAVESFSKAPAVEENKNAKDGTILSINPVDNTLASNASSSDSGVAAALNSPAPVQSDVQLPEEHYEFEDIFSGLITEIETEILFFDS